MKSSKNYIAATIAIQMIVVPIVLTVGLILVSAIIPGVIDTSPKSPLGSSAIKFIYVLIAFLGSFIVGGIIGSIFSRVSESKPESAVARYLTPMLPVLYAAIFAIIALVFSNGNYNSGLWGIYVYKNPAFLIFDFALAFAGLNFIIPVAELAGYIGFAAGIFLHELISKSGIRSKSGRSLKAVFVVLFAAVITLCYISTENVVSNGIIELQYGKATVGNELQEFDLINIAPFKEKNGLARLEEQASLQFTELDEMPRLDGATAAYPVYGAFVEAVYKGLGDYYKTNMKNSDKEFFSAFVSSNDYPYNVVKCSKTSGAYENLINGQADIIFVAEPSKKQEEMVKAKGDEFVLTPIGSEAFVFFTNIKNPVENLTVKEIQDIYSGQITNWKKVKGENKRILPYQRPENSGSQTIMQNKVMKDIKMLKPTTETFASGMGGIISQVASYKNAKNAIGYSFMYYSSSMIKNNQIKYVSVNGIKPTRETVRNREYPFTIPVYAVTLKSETNKNVKKFIDWILSDEGQSLVEKTGYVPVR